MFEHFDKKYLKEKGLKLASVAFVLAIAAYFGYQAWRYYATDVRCEPATAYTVAEKSSGDGCIFRSEFVISDKSDGSVISSVGIGERVSFGEKVADIYSYSSSEVEKKLSEIEEQIKLLSEVKNTEAFTGKDSSKLDDEIYSFITNMSRGISSGDYSEPLSYKSSVISAINKKGISSGSQNDSTTKISELENEKSALKNQLGSLNSTVSAPCAGWYYPSCDGYEGIFTVDKIKNLTYDSFRELVKTSPATAMKAGKIVTNCNWYFVCEMSEESLKTKNTGEEYTLYFPYNRNEKLTMTLYKICEGSEGFGVAVFATDKMPSDFDYLRMQSYEILEKEYTGFRVPKTAVRIIDGQTGVFVLTGEIVHFRKIEIMTEYENSYIVEMDHDENEPASSNESESDGVSGETSSDDGFDPSESPWLQANENIIVKGKGMKEGRIITNIE